MQILPTWAYRNRRLSRNSPKLLSLPIGSPSSERHSSRMGGNGQGSGIVFWACRSASTGGNSISKGGTGERLYCALFIGRICVKQEYVNMFTSSIRVIALLSLLQTSSYARTRSEISCPLCPLKIALASTYSRISCRSASASLVGWLPQTLALYAIRSPWRSIRREDLFSIWFRTNTTSTVPTLSLYSLARRGQRRRRAYTCILIALLAASVWHRTKPVSRYWGVGHCPKVLYDAGLSSLVSSASASFSSILSSRDSKRWCLVNRNHWIHGRQYQSHQQSHLCWKTRVEAWKEKRGRISARRSWEKHRTWLGHLRVQSNLLCPIHHVRLLLH